MTQALFQFALAAVVGGIALFLVGAAAKHAARKDANPWE